ncbi:MAG TPA: heme-binding protein [Stellaceae bacterium]|nr:heme-binding protein [Stellaceae bacterium]
MTAITLDQASRIVDAALSHGRELGLAPLTVTVLDPGGHVVALKREDGSGNLRPDIAFGKAWGALGMGFGSRTLARRAGAAPAFFAALNAVSDGRVVPVPGGVLIRDERGTLMGAVGISGDTSDQDEICALFGIKRVGLAADPGTND